MSFSIQGAVIAKFRDDIVFCLAVLVRCLDGIICTVEGVLRRVDGVGYRTFDFCHDLGYMFSRPRATREP